MRKRFTERQVIETLIRQGAVIKSYRSKEPITLENVGTVEREHILERALGGEDIPANCAYSLGEEHAVVTNGTKATTAGSSKQRIAKVKRLERARKAMEEANRRFVGKVRLFRVGGYDPDAPRPKRKIPSRPFAKLPKRQAVRG